VLWNVRQGHVSVGRVAMRAIGTTVIIEDVAFPLSAASPRRRSRCRSFSAEHGYGDAIIFGHALEGNLQLRLHAGFQRPKPKSARYRVFMDALVPDGRRALRRVAQGRARARGPRTSRRSSSSNGAADAYRIMRAIKRCSIRTACSIPAC
jgi:D-lactate dehydrogenase